MKKRYIITGASGFLGNNIVRQLASGGNEIRGLVMPGEDTCALEGLDCQLFRGDVTKAETLASRAGFDPC